MRLIDPAIDHPDLHARPCVLCPTDRVPRRRHVHQVQRGEQVALELSHFANGRYAWEISQRGRFFFGSLHENRVQQRLHGTDLAQIAFHKRGAKLALCRVDLPLPVGRGRIPELLLRTNLGGERRIR